MLLNNPPWKKIRDVKKHRRLSLDRARELGELGLKERDDS
jgi:hypothetical protein